MPKFPSIFAPRSNSLYKTTDRAAQRDNIRQPSPLCQPSYANDSAQEQHGLQLTSALAERERLAHEPSSCDCRASNRRRKAPHRAVSANANAATHRSNAAPVSHAAMCPSVVGVLGRGAPATSRNTRRPDPTTSAIPAFCR